MYVNIEVQTILITRMERCIDDQLFSCIPFNVIPFKYHLRLCNRSIETRHEYGLYNNHYYVIGDLQENQHADNLSHVNVLPGCITLTEEPP